MITTFWRDSFVVSVHVEVGDVIGGRRGENPFREGHHADARSCSAVVAKKSS